MRLKLRRGEDWQERKLENAGYCFGDDKGGDAPEAPDYGPMAAASAQAAETAAKSSAAWLAENQRQYDNNMAVASPIIDLQSQQTQQQINQGNDYWNYNRSYRPAEQAMLAQAFGLSASDLNAYNDQRAAALNLGQSNWQAGIDAHRAALNQQLAALGADRQAYLSGLDQSNAAAQAKYDADVASGMYAGTGYSQPAAFDPRKLHQYNDGSENGGNYFAYDGFNPALPAGYGASPSGPTGPTLQSADPSRLQGWTDREKAINDQLAALGKKVFDPTAVDYSAADKYGVNALMGAASAKASKEQAEVDRINATDAKFYDANKDAVDFGVNNAIADNRNGTTQQMNQLIRQGLRYGWSPDKLASMGAGAAVTNAQNMVAAANAARTQGIDRERGLQTNNRNMRLQNEATAFGKQMDTIGLSKGLVGASQGAYSLANNFGNSAVQNQLATSQAYMGNMGNAYNLQQQGLGQQISGLGSVLNSQSNLYNSSMNSGGGDNSGAMIGAAGSIAAAMI